MEHSRESKLQPSSNHERLQNSASSKLWKASKVLLAGFIIGLLDALQAVYLHIGAFGKDVSILYQIVFMAAAAAGAAWCLYDRNWSISRNVLNLMMTIPVATLADNISFDLQTLKPYVIILPKSGFVWRLHVFSHTVLYPIASWVDLQTFARGLTDGYVTAIAIAVGYMLIQSYWSRLETNRILAGISLKWFVGLISRNNN